MSTSTGRDGERREGERRQGERRGSDRREAASEKSAAGTEPRIGRQYYDTSDYFDEASPHLRDLRSAFQRYRVQKVLEIHDPGRETRVLDLGCGWGTFSLTLAHRVRSVVGVDFSEKSIESCRQRARDLGIRNVEFVQADASDTGLDGESVDIVIAADLLEHLYPDQTDAVLDECARTLKRGGRLVVWTPNPGHVLERLKNRNLLLRRDVSHVDYKSMERIRSLLLAREFSIEKAYFVESHVPGLRAVERSLMSSVPFLRRRIAVLARKR